MQNKSSLQPLLLLLLSVLWAGSAFADACQDAVLASNEKTFADACTITAVREPYKLAWLTLARLCDLGAAEPGPCVWQRWATFADTYPAEPDPSHRPAWPNDDGKYPPKVLPEKCTASPSAGYGDNPKTP